MAASRRRGVGWAALATALVSCATLEAGRSPLEAQAPLPALAPDLAEQPVQVASLAHWQGHLVAVLGDGRRAAWRTSDLAYEPALSEALAAAGVEQVGTEGETLLGLTDGWVLAWEPGARRWTRRYPVERTSEVLERFVTWPGGVALVYGDHVFEARRQRGYPVPPLDDGEGGATELQLSDALGRESHLWLGENRGEFGGHLVGLDLDSGRWTQRRTPGVTALTTDGEGLLAADAHCLFSSSQLHRFSDTGELVGSLARVDDGCFLTLARGLDGSPWVADGRQLSRLDEDGRPRLVVELGLAPRVNMGGTVVTPGVVALLAVDERTWAVLPTLEPVVVVRDGAARTLTLPPRPVSRYLPVRRWTNRPVNLSSNGAVADRFCSALADARDRWDFVDPDGGHRVADSCAFPSPGAVADFRRRPVEPGRWVFSDARGRRLEQVDVSVGLDGSVVVHERWWGPSGHLRGEGTRRLRPCCSDLGVRRSYHLNGRLGFERSFEDGRSVGRLTAWHVNGVKALAGQFDPSEKRTGTWTRWYLDGQKQVEGTFSEGRLQGTVTEWAPDGRTLREWTFRDGEPRTVREWGPGGQVSERAARTDEWQHPL